MPIKHLQSARSSFPCIGKLRKGSAKQLRSDGKEVMGRDLDHFRFVTDDGDAAAVFAAYYGSEPKTVSCFLPYATTDENFQAWLEEYRAGGLVRRCDGETCVFHRDAQGRPITVPTPCTKQCGCKQVGRLAIIIPQLARLAYVLVETHSTYDIIQLTENLQAAQALRGDLRGIPFVLSRREREISTPTDNGGRARRKKWLLFIEPDPQWVTRQLESMRLAALPIVELPPAQKLLADTTLAFSDEPDDDDTANDGVILGAQPPVAQPAVTQPEIPSEVAAWRTPDDAYAWAVEIGASDNVFAARNAMKNIVDAHGGRFTRENAAIIYTAYYQDRMTRAQEKAKAALETLDMADVPEVDLEG